MLTRWGLGALGLACLVVLACAPQAAKAPASGPNQSPLPLATLDPKGPKAADSQGDGPFWLAEKDQVLAKQIVAWLSDEEVLAQVFMLGWSSQDAEGPIMDWIRDRGVGGVKIFGWNGNDTARLAKTIALMQGAALGTRASLPLLTATDQEGGWVRHIKGDTARTPGNLAIGAADLASDAYYSAFYIAKQLRAIGVNMNFAPTVDVYTNPEAHVIGPRAFSDDPQLTAEFASAYFHGQEKARVISTAKHFPGHGNAIGDSHGVLPVLADDLATLMGRELVPYETLIPEGLPAILSGHLSFPKIAGDGKPASLSGTLITGLLRQKLGFQGLVVTDDLYMGGAADFGHGQGWSMDETVFQALKAGNDMVMLSRTPDLNSAIWRRCLSAYQHDPAFRSQIQESVTRIIALKLRYLKPQDRVPLKPDPGTIHQEMDDQQSETFFRDQAYRAVTVVRGENLPFKPKAGESVAIIGQDSTFIRLARARFPQASVLEFDIDPFYSSDPAVRAEAAERAAGADHVLFGLLNPNSLGVLEALAPYQKKVVVLSSLTPVYLNKTPWVKTAVAVFGWGPDSYRAGLDALQGIFTPTGVLPVKVQ